MKKTHGLLLINLGTPVSAKVTDVRQYLKEFLSDSRVIDLPTPLRQLLLYGIILPFRTKKSAHAYESIVTENGMPLLVHTRDLTEAVQVALPDFRVVFAMRYGQPSIQQALTELKDCEFLTVLPLYPQYASSSTGSSLEEVMRVISQYQVQPHLRIIRDFYSNPVFIQGVVDEIKPYLETHEHLILSYHGLPERHIIKGGCTSVCASPCPMSKASSGCYRAQCFETTRAIIQKLGLNDTKYSQGFQSRLGKPPWIQPYTDELLPKLFNQGIRRLAVVCPSFVADCLETIEEIGIRANQDWKALGGEQLTLIPSLNATSAMVNTIKALIV
jgi:ferrochelatase